MTARLDESNTQRLLVLIAHGHPPKVRIASDQDVGYAPVSYIVEFSGTESPPNVTFFGRCESCIVNHMDFDFGGADAEVLSALIDPKHLWVY